MYLIFATAIGTTTALIAGWFVVKVLSILADNKRMRQEKVKDDLSNVKKSIRDDIDSMPLEDLVRK